MFFLSSFKIPIIRPISKFLFVNIEFLTGIQENRLRSFLVFHIIGDYNQNNLQINLKFGVDRLLMTPNNILKGKN